MHSHAVQSHAFTPTHYPQVSTAKDNTNCGPNRYQRNTSFIETMSEYLASSCASSCQDQTTIEEFASVPSNINTGETRKKYFTKNDLKVIPPLYPLDKTFKVMKKTSADFVSGRLCRSIRMFDLATKWTNSDPTLLYCTTNDFLKFEINLWKQEHDSSTDGDMKSDDELCDIIIEIRRYQGDCVRFHQMRNSLYSYICDTETNQSFDEGYKNCNVYRTSMPTTSNNCTPHLRPLALDNLMDVLNSVTMAYEMIFNQNTVDIVMGLQMLTFLTDSTSIHRVYAAHVSDFILLGHDIFGNNVPAVRDVIYNYVVKERDCVERHYALQILTNAFENSSLQQEIPTKNANTEIDSWNSVIPSLIRDMKNVERNPHVTYNAIRCLRTWYSLAGIHAEMSYKDDILSSVEKVRLFGEQWYISLEKESTNLKFALL